MAPPPPPPPANADGHTARRIPSPSPPNTPTTSVGSTTRPGPGPLGMDRNMNTSTNTNWGKQTTAMTTTAAATSPVRTRSVNVHDRSSPVQGSGRGRSLFQDERPHRFENNPRQQEQQQAQAHAQPNYESMMHQTPPHHHRRPRVQFTSLSERNMVLNNSSSNSTVGSTGSDARYNMTSKKRSSSSPSPSTRRTNHHFYLSNTTTSPGGNHQSRQRQLQRMNSGGSVSSDTGNGSVKSAPGWHGQYDSNYNNSSSSINNNKNMTMKKNNSSHISSSSSNIKTSSTRGMTTMSMQQVTATTTQKNKASTTDVNAAQTELPTKQQTKQTKKVIDDLKKSTHQNPEKRIVSLTTACSCFDHQDEARHDMELQLGVVNVLSKVLSVTIGDIEKLASRSPSSKKYDAHSIIVRLVAVALEMIFRGASHAAISMAFTKTPGWGQLKPILRVLELAEEGSIQQADVTILNLSRELLYVSRIPDLRAPLAQEQGVLDFVSRISTSILNADGRVVRLRILTNLVYDDENKTMILERDGLLDSVLQISHLDMDATAREYASIILMDLASSSTNQVVMAKNERLLGILVKMATVEKVANTREAAITSIQSLAYSKGNRERMVVFKNGIILEAMKKALNSDNNEKCRKRAAGAITNLVSDETTETMGRYKGLLDTLAVVSTNDISQDVRDRAAVALTKLAACITVRMEDCFPTCLDALIVASLKNSSISSVLRVKARDPANRSSMVSHPGILDTLADICLEKSSRTESMELTGTDDLDLQRDTDNAMRAIMHLANDDKNRLRMCTPRIIDALVEGAKLPDGDPLQEDIRDSAIRAIGRLATEFDNRSILARHEGMLVAIAAAAEREARLDTETSLAAKKKVAGADMVNRDKVHLAKALLMSLLVAM